MNILLRKHHSPGLLVTSALHKLTLQVQSKLGERTSGISLAQAQQLSGYNADDKKAARDFVDELINLKQCNGDINEDMMLFNPKIKAVMQRYGIENLNDLNNWLEHMMK